MAVQASVARRGTGATRKAGKLGTAIQAKPKSGQASQPSTQAGQTTQTNQLKASSTDQPQRATAQTVADTRNRALANPVALQMQSQLSSAVDALPPSGGNTVAAAAKPPHHDTPEIAAAEQAVASAQEDLRTANRNVNTASGAEAKQQATEAREVAQQQLNQAQAVLELRTAEADVAHWKSQFAAGAPGGLTQLTAAKERFNAAATPETIAYDMRLTAQNLSANGAGATQLQADVLQRGVELFQNAPVARDASGRLDPAKAMDWAVAATGRVLVGDAGLETLDMAIQGKLGISFGDAHTQSVRDMLASLPEDAFAGGGLDRSNGTTDLAPQFNDGTPNQAFHTFNFVLAGYALPNNGLGFMAGQAGNFLHEAIQGNTGASMEDYNASKAGLQVGMTLRRMRDNPSADSNHTVGELAPGMISAMFGRDSGPISYDVNGRQIEIPAEVVQRLQAMRALDGVLPDPIRDATEIGVSFWQGLEAAVEASFNFRKLIGLD